MPKDINQESKEMGSFLLDIGTALLASGASCARIEITIKRFAITYGFNVHTAITPRAVSITLHQNNATIPAFNGIRTIPVQGVNFKVIAGISKLSWDAIERNLTVENCKNALTTILSFPSYPRFIILFFVSLAGAAFCFCFGGSFIELSITFLSTFIGLFVRQEAAKKKFNNYICVFLGSLTATLVAGAFLKFNNTIYAEHAFTTSVLYLIPGVPLINCITDLIDGHILNGMVRGMHALIFACAIALGMLVSMFIYNM